MSSSDVPKAFHVMAKPTGSACNLKCDYCFFLKKSYGIHAESALRECEALHKYVIACKEPFIAVQETRPCRNSTFMIGICTIKEGIQC